MQVSGLRLFFLILGLGLFACSHRTTDEVRPLGEMNLIRVTRIWPHLMRVRRPVYESANPSASEGGSDYKTTRSESKNFDCEKSESLFKDFRLKEIRQCFVSISPSTVIQYRFVRSAQPALQLEDEENAPSCIVAHLKQIPVPREIVFQTPVKNSLDCYVARVDVESSEKFGIKMPIAKVDMKVKFPLKKLPTDDSATLRLLQGWSLTPFFRDLRNIESVPDVMAVLMPERMCKACMGDQAISQDLELDAPLWP